MVRAFVFLAKLPVLPLDADWRMDIVPADYVGAGIVAVHMQDKPEHGAYNLSTGRGLAHLPRDRRRACASRVTARVTCFAPKLDAAVRARPSTA